MTEMSENDISVSEELEGSPLHQDDEDTTNLPSAEVDAAEAPAKQLTRNQRKAIKRQLKRQEKQAKLANSVVRTLPEDPLEKARQSAYAELESQLEQLPALKELDMLQVLAEFPVYRKRLEELDSKVKSVQQEFHSKTARPVGAVSEATIQEVVREIQEMEVKATVDQVGIEWRVGELVKAISVLNQRRFTEQLEALSERISQRLQEDVKHNEQEVYKYRRKGIAERIINLKSMGQSEDDAKVTEDQVTRVVIDIHPAAAGILFYPQNVARKIEQNFSVAIDRVGGTPSNNPDYSSPGGSEARRNPNAPPRAIEVWGVFEDVERAAKFIRSCDFMARPRKTVDRKLLPTIIGRNGANIRALESSNGVMLTVDNLDIVALGPPEACAKAFAQIDELKLPTQTAPQGYFEMAVDPFVARALSGMNVTKLRALENSHKVNVRATTGPNNTNPRLTVRCKANEVEKAKQLVKSEIVDQFCTLYFSAPTRAVNRIMYPPRGNMGESANSGKPFNSEFSTLKDALGLFVSKISVNELPSQPESVVDMTSLLSSTLTGGSSSPTDGGASPSPVISGIAIVSATSDSQIVIDKVKDLLKRASYVTHAIPVQRELMRIFSPETRALIEESSGCTFSFSATGQGNDRSFSLLLHGSQEDIDKGSKLVNDILEREGHVEEIQLESNEVIVELLRNRGSLAQSIELDCDVNVSIDREKNVIKIIGFESNIGEAKERIQKLDAFNKSTTATETYNLKVDARCLSQVIGRGGAMIKQIQKDTGVHQIRINDSSSKTSSSTEASITIVGEQTCINSAVSMIQKIAARTTNAKKPDDNELSTDAVTPSTSGVSPSIDDSNQTITAKPRTTREWKPPARNYRGSANTSIVGGAFKAIDDHDSYPSLSAAKNVPSRNSPNIISAPDTLQKDAVESAAPALTDEVLLGTTAQNNTYVEEEPDSPPEDDDDNDNSD